MTREAPITTEPQTDPQTQLLDALEQALAEGRFVKLSLGKGRSGHRHAHVRLVEIRKEPHLTLLIRRDGAADDTQNHPVAHARAVISELLATRFENAHLFTTTEDIELRTNRKHTPWLSRHRPTFKTAEPTEHNRVKRYVLDPEKAPWLRALGIVTDSGVVRSDKADKYRQLQNLIKILDDRVERSELPTRARPRIVDMGAGKGYLTFALHDYFRNYLGQEAQVIGVDRNQTLMTTCNGVAADLGLAGLSFECGDVDSFQPGPRISPGSAAQPPGPGPRTSPGSATQPPGPAPSPEDGNAIDLLVALHACDTATDTAIYKGITAGAAVIMAVPCCQKELRPQLGVPHADQPFLKHDTFKDRLSQMITDALRGLWMEAMGYKTHIMEFISDAHTHRNVLIIGVRGGVSAGLAAQRRAEALALEARYGITHQHLHALLAASET